MKKVIFAAAIFFALIDVALAGLSAPPVNTDTIRLGTKTIVSKNVPTITTGFGTSPSIGNVFFSGSSTGSLMFTINVGTGGTASSGQLLMPFAAAHGWLCSFVPTGLAKPGQATKATVQVSSSTTVLTVQNELYTTGAVSAWDASSTYLAICTAA